MVDSPPHHLHRKGSPNLILLLLLLLLLARARARARARVSRPVYHDDPSWALHAGNAGFLLERPLDRFPTIIVPPANIIVRSLFSQRSVRGALPH